MMRSHQKSIPRKSGRLQSRSIVRVLRLLLWGRPAFSARKLLALEPPQNSRLSRISDKTMRYETNARRRDCPCLMCSQSQHVADVATICDRPPSPAMEPLPWVDKAAQCRQGPKQPHAHRSQGAASSFNGFRRMQGAAGFHLLDTGDDATSGLPQISHELSMILPTVVSRAWLETTATYIFNICTPSQSTPSQRSV